MARFRVFSAGVNPCSAASSHSISKTQALFDVARGWAWDISHIVGFRAIQMLRAAASNVKRADPTSDRDLMAPMHSGEVPGVRFVGPKQPNAVRVRAVTREDREDQLRDWHESISVERQMFAGCDLIS